MVLAAVQLVHGPPPTSPEQFLDHIDLEFRHVSIISELPPRIHLSDITTCIASENKESPQKDPQNFSTIIWT